MNLNRRNYSKNTQKPTESQGRHFLIILENSGILQSFLTSILRSLDEGHMRHAMIPAGKRSSFLSD
jgi:hypothetical protein